MSFEFFQISLFIFARYSKSDDIIASVYERLSSSLFISLADDDDDVVVVIIIIISSSSSSSSSSSIARKMRVCVFFCKVSQTRCALGILLTREFFV